MSAAIGVDLGGTAVKIGICDNQGKLIHKFVGQTSAAQGAKTVLANITNYIHQIVESSPYEWKDITGIGFGIAGFLHIEQGIVRLSPNLNWRDIPITSKLSETLPVPVKITNDASAAALGEAWIGAGKDVDLMVCLTLGTGIGGGIVYRGQLVQGAQGMVGEIGHLAVVPDLEAVRCGCGQMGCLETVASAKGIVRMACDAASRGEQTKLSEIESITAKDVFDLARASDEVALRIVNRACYYLAKAMAQVNLIVNPQCFIIGGGLSLSGELLIERLKEQFLSLNLDVYNHTEIVSAKLGNDAGIIGAARLCSLE